MTLATWYAHLGSSQRKDRILERSGAADSAVSTTSGGDCVLLSFCSATTGAAGATAARDDTAAAVVVTAAASVASQLALRSHPSSNYRRSPAPLA